MKLLYWDGQGFCLYYKVLQKGRFPWPAHGDGAVRLTSAQLDRPSLQPLPPEPYVFARWKRTRVAPDYHVEVDSSWYFVPFALIKQEVDVRVAGQTVEIFHRGQRVASHVRTPGRRNHVTEADHMPSAHRRLGEWTPARMLAQATTLQPRRGLATDRLGTLMKQRLRCHPDQ